MHFYNNWSILGSQKPRHGAIEDVEEIQVWKDFEKMKFLRPTRVLSLTVVLWIHIFFSCRCGTTPSHSRHDPPNDPYFGINLGIDSPTQETIRIGDPVQVIRMQRSNLPLSQKVILAAISVSTLVSIVAVVLRKYRWNHVYLSQRRRLSCCFVCFA